MEVKKTIGILGGMGPLATADLFIKIVTQTKAAGGGSGRGGPPFMGGEAG